jgi:large subunit ribosomal protein L6
VQGVIKNFEKRLEIQGVGYNAKLKGTNLELQMGYSHPVVLPVPDGIIAELPSNIKIVIRGVDKHLVGQFAANIRRVRPPDPYKGKGIRYEGETLRKKAGKSFAGGD